MPNVEKKIVIDETLWRTARAAAALEGKTVSDWISKRLRAELATVLPPPPAELTEVSLVRTDAEPGQMDDHGAWGFKRKEDPGGPDRD